MKLSSLVVLTKDSLARHAPVNTHAPSSVIATECSKCAERLPSAVTTVQPSSNTRTAPPPALSIGSMARASPFCKRTPRPAAPQLGPPGPPVLSPADPVTDEIPNDRETLAERMPLDRRAQISESITRPALRD